MSRKIICLALLIRILLIPWFYHPDIKSQNFHYQFLSAGVFDVYSFIGLNQWRLPYRDTFNYLPLTYLTFGILQVLLRPFLPSDFFLWLNDWGERQNYYPNLPYFLLILKLPYLVLDFFIAFLLHRISRQKSLAQFWLFNPLSFYLIYVLGNFDILPLVFCLLAYYFLKKRPVFGFSFLGTAISLKLYPLLFLPLYLIDLKKYRLWPKFILLTLIVPLLTILPFLNSHYFWQSFLGSGLTQKIIETRFLGLPVFPVFYLVILVFAYAKKMKLSHSLALVFFLFITTVKFHPQWILWFLPFIFLTSTFRHHRLFFTLVFFLLLAIIFLFNDSYLTWGYLIPIDPEFVNLRTPHDFFRLRYHLNPVRLQDYLRYLIAFLSLIYIFGYEKFYFRRHF